LDIYKDTLFASHKREPLTRANLSSIIGKTEETVKDGISITSLLPFFEKYRIPLRVFDCTYKLVFKHNPPLTSRDHPKAMYVLQKNNHIYTLNHDLKRLKQKLHEDYGFTLSASENYYINEKEKYNTFKMLENIDDVLKVIKTHIAKHPDEKDDVQVSFNCVYKTDNLEKLLFEIIGAGYDPQINFNAGNIQRIVLRLQKRFTFLVTSQQLLPDSIDGQIDCNHEDEYNNMYVAQGEFYDALFNPSHKSYYSSHDIDILDEYRTIAQSGQLKQFGPKTKLTEIDVSKAYTNALQQIEKIPIFNEFDIFLDYDQHELEDLTLYVAKTINGNLFLNKKFNLVYGSVLKQLKADDYEITQYKRPSKVKDVDYKSIVRQLYDNPISDLPEDDKLIKKTIANVNIGLLEKGTNKKTKSILFEDLNECKFFQSEFGGKIIVIDEHERSNLLKTNYCDHGLDFGIEEKVLQSVKILRDVTASKRVYCLV